MEENTTQTTSNGNGMNPMIIGGIVILLLVIGGVFFGRNLIGGSTTSTSEMNHEEIAPSSATSSSESDTASTDEVKEIKIEAGAFYFNPKEIRVKKGQKVKITLTAKDMMHDFYIDEFNVKSDIVEAGETTTIEFTPDQTGTFEYYCSVGQHRANGQVGKLIVE